MFLKTSAIFIICFLSLPVTSYGHFFNNDWGPIFAEIPLPQEFISTKGSKSAASIPNHVDVFQKHQDQKLYCKYPARYFYLNQKGLLPSVDYTHCQDLQEFLKRAPIQEISIMFAAESLTQPASIVGHSFLKISGLDDEKIKREHAISFFTRMDDVNAVTLFIQSFLTGKKGYYVLGPLSESIDYYIKKEGRTLWEYKLKFSEEELEFLRLYLFELKNIKFKYYFHGFNCATLLQQILLSVYPEIDKAGHLWVTPLDLVKSLYQHDRVEERVIYPNSGWLLRQLDQEKVSSYQKDSAENFSEKDKAITYHRLKAKQNYLFERHKLSFKEYKSQTQKLDEDFEDHKDYDQLSFENLKGPEHTVQDSQIYFGATRSSGGHMLYRLSLLPLSHQLFNASKGRAFESEVKLLGVDLAYLEDDGFRLRELNLFKIQTYSTHNKVTGGLSGQFDLSFKHNAQNLFLEDKKRLEITTSLGKTFRLHPDIDFYLWPSVNVFISDKTDFIFNPQTGLILREIFNMKTLMSYEYQLNTDRKDIHILNLTHTINFGNSSIGVNYSRYFKNEQNQEQLEAFLAITF
ncbi:MAG: DUF4105 domain-containing protein [Bdellovibrionaceae bacterium]|nr:DUF4105 domain-containing protein [Pseudobdellovibrionaceae bacterium]